MTTLFSSSASEITGSESSSDTTFSCNCCCVSLRCSREFWRRAISVGGMRLCYKYFIIQPPAVITGMSSKAACSTVYGWTCRDLYSMICYVGRCNVTHSDCDSRVLILLHFYGEWYLLVRFFPNVVGYDPSSTIFHAFLTA